MRKTRILILATAILLLVCVFASCSQKGDYTVTLKIQAGNIALLDLPVKMNSENTTVIEVVRQAMQQDPENAGVMIILDEKGEGIEAIKDNIDGTEYLTGLDSATKMINGWEFYINGEEEVRKGLASDVEVTDGDTIRYMYYSQEYSE